jgi:DNA uptake protein ComE-like DNA-binding protein
MNLRRWLGAPKPTTPPLTDPYYRFQTPTEVEQAAQLGVRIDVNKAGVDDWVRLPGISIHQAKTLVQLSQAGLRFYSIEDLATALGLSVQRLLPLSPILLFCYYETQGGRLNANTSSVEALLELPGIDTVLAHQWVRERVNTGPYQNLGQLQQRLNLSGEMLEQLLPHLQF